MKLHRPLFRGLWSVMVISFFFGCQSLPERMPAYLGSVSQAGASKASPEDLPTESSQVGLLVITDATTSGSAPPLTEKMLTILENRLVEKVHSQFPFSIRPVSLDKKLNPVGDIRPLLGLAQTNNIDFLMVAIFSSTEVESNSEIGEARMMTRMTAEELENDALAELALLDGSSGHLVIRANGVGGESMNILAAPLGEDYPSGEEARNILRGNAAQKALDNAILELKREWSKVAGV